MKVALLTGLRTLEIADLPMPKLSGPGDALLRIDRVGVCGSDVHYYLRGRIGNQVVEFPASVGHECSATVVEVGSAVEGLEPGHRVAVEPALSCGHCDQCRAGRPHTCRKLQFMGCPKQAPGAMAEYRVMPAKNCYRVPDGVSLDEAALAEPLSIGAYAVQLAGPKPGAKVAVLGSGPIGLSVLVSLKAAGPATVYATDLIDDRLSAADHLGADWTGNARREDVVAEIARREPLGIDVVLECSGDPACLGQALELAAPGGTLAMVGIPPVPEVSFDVDTMRHKELAIRNVRRQTGCVTRALNLLSGGSFDTSAMLTHRFALEEITEAFELVAGYRDGVIKAVIDISGAE